MTTPTMPLRLPALLMVLLSWATLVSPKDKGTLFSHALTDEEYKLTMGEGYLFFEVTEPEELQYTFKINPAAFGEPWNFSRLGVSLVLSDPVCGCGSYRNPDEVEGAIALVERGDCSFVSKVVKAEEAGAIAIIITDNDQENDDLYIIMQDDTTQREVHIPAAFLLGKNGQVIRHTLHKLQLTEARVNIPVNISNIPIHRLKQPPWLVW